MKHNGGMKRRKKKCKLVSLLWRSRAYFAHYAKSSRFQMGKTRVPYPTPTPYWPLHNNDRVAILILHCLISYITYTVHEHTYSLHTQTSKSLSNCVTRGGRCAFYYLYTMYEGEIETRYRVHRTYAQNTSRIKRNEDNNFVFVLRIFVLVFY